MQSYNVSYTSRIGYNQREISIATRVRLRTRKTSSACCLVAPAGIGTPGCCTGGGICTEAMVAFGDGVGPKR